MTAVQTIVRLAGHPGLWSQHGTNHDGSIDVRGPVIWSETRGRYIDNPGRCRTRCVPADHIRPAQLRLEVTA